MEITILRFIARSARYGAAACNSIARAATRIEWRLVGSPVSLRNIPPMTRAVAIYYAGPREALARLVA